MVGGDACRAIQHWCTNSLLQMKLQLTEAERDMYFAEWEASHEREAATNQLVERVQGIARRAVCAHADLCREK